MRWPRARSPEVKIVVEGREARHKAHASARRHRYARMHKVPAEDQCRPGVWPEQGRRRLAFSRVRTLLERPEAGAAAREARGTALRRRCGVGAGERDEHRQRLVILRNRCAVS
eukprot:scaffold88007_cov75-Phaeocystis_antarctica.AAC.2